MSHKIFTSNEGARDSDLKLLWSLITANSVRSQSVTIGTTATAIPTSALTQRKILTLKNMGTEQIYIGASDVTTSNGYALDPRDVFEMAIEEEITLYGVSTSGGQDLRILERG